MATHTPQTETPAPGDSYVQSFARGLQVIRSFSESAPRQTLSEVAAATGLTRAGARRILHADRFRHRACAEPGRIA